MTEGIQYNNSCRPPLAGWMGGKSILARRIIELLPEHACYVEPFAGAAWVLFRKTESKSEVLNDINRDITTLYRVVKYHLEEFIRYFKWSLVARDEFDRLRAANADTLTDIQRAARFYYLQHCGFNGRVVSPTFRYATKARPKLNLLRIEEHLSEAHLRLSRVYIECLPYQEVIQRYDRAETCFYVDPPYWGCEEYYGKGLFSRDDFSELAGILKSIKGRFIISLNDTPGVREAFSGFRFDVVSTRYNCAFKEQKKETSEVLILNW